MFFDTPHRAVDHHSWEDLVLKIAFSSSQHPSDRFSKAIKAASMALMELEEEFYGIAGRYNILDIYANGDKVSFEFSYFILTDAP